LAKDIFPAGDVERWEQPLLAGKGDRVAESTFEFSVKDYGWLTLDLTKHVQAWVSGGWPNQGLLLETVDREKDMKFNQVGFYASDYAVLPSLRPRLILVFKDKPKPISHSVKEKNPGGFAAALFVVVVGANAAQAFVTTGPPPFMGQADPLRFSLNPRRWVWLADDELRGRISLRGSWTIPVPDPAHVDAPTDPALGPLAALPMLSVERWEELGAALDGRLTDLARGGSGRFLAVTEGWGVHLLDEDLARVEHHVTLDRHFAVELTGLAGAAFVGDTLVAMASNKSYVLLRPDPDADEDHEWRYFVETGGGVSELRRSRLATVRARQQYVLSVAYDAEADELVTVSVPSPRHRRLVVSRFDRGDLTLSSEFLPRLGAGLGLAGEGRSLAEYVVTGAAVADGTLWTVSAAYSTVLAVDLAAREVVGAWGVPGLEQPVGLALRGGELLVAQADGRIAVVARPGAVSEPPLP